MMTRLAFALLGLALACAAGAQDPSALRPAQASGQAFPSKPIRFLVPYPPGGGTDIVARAVGQKLQESMGQPVLVENRPGASEIIGTEALARSAPDGHTIALVGSFAINPSLFPKLPYDSERDFIPVTRLVNVPLALVAHPSVPASSVKELVQLAKSRPGKLNFAHLGAGSPHYLAMEWFKHLAGVDIVAVPYKGVAPANAAVAAGEVQIMFTGLTAGLAQVKAGRLKALAVSPAKRVGAAPELPSVAEAGYPDFDIMVWYGVVAPAGTPAETLAKLNAEIAKALGAADLKQRFAAMGIEAAPLPAGEFGRFIRSETQMWGRIIKATGAKPD